MAATTTGAVSPVYLGAMDSSSTDVSLPSLEVVLEPVQKSMVTGHFKAVKTKFGPKQVYIQAYQAKHQVHQLIAKHPQMPPGNIAEETGLSLGAVEDHLETLHDQEKVAKDQYGFQSKFKVVLPHPEGFTKVGAQVYPAVKAANLKPGMEMLTPGDTTGSVKNWHVGGVKQGKGKGQVEFTVSELGKAGGATVALEKDPEKLVPLDPAHFSHGASAGDLKTAQAAYHEYAEGVKYPSTGLAIHDLATHANAAVEKGKLGHQEAIDAFGHHPALGLDEEEPEAAAKPQEAPQQLTALQALEELGGAAGVVSIKQHAHITQGEANIQLKEAETAGKAHFAFPQWHLGPAPKEQPKPLDEAGQLNEKLAGALKNAQTQFKPNPALMAEPVEPEAPAGTLSAAAQETLHLLQLAGGTANEAYLVYNHGGDDDAIEASVQELAQKGLIASVGSDNGGGLWKALVKTYQEAPTEPEAPAEPEVVLGSKAGIPPSVPFSMLSPHDQKKAKDHLESFSHVTSIPGSEEASQSAPVAQGAPPGPATSVLHTGDEGALLDALQSLGSATIGAVGNKAFPSLSDKAAWHKANKTLQALAASGHVQSDGKKWSVVAESPAPGAVPTSTAPGPVYTEEQQALLAVLKLGGGKKVPFADLIKNTPGVPNPGTAIALHELKDKGFLEWKNDIDGFEPTAAGIALWEGLSPEAKGWQPTNVGHLGNNGWVKPLPDGTQQVVWQYAVGGWSAAVQSPKGTTEFLYGSKYPDAQSAVNAAELGVPDITHAQSNPLYQNLVLNALKQAAPDGLTHKELIAQIGGSESYTSAALTALHAQGAIKYNGHNFKWYLTLAGEQVHAAQQAVVDQAKAKAAPPAPEPVDYSFSHAPGKAKDIHELLQKGPLSAHEIGQQLFVGLNSSTAWNKAQKLLSQLEAAGLVEKDGKKWQAKGEAAAVAADPLAHVGGAAGAQAKLEAGKTYGAAQLAHALGVPYDLHLAQTVQALKQAGIIDAVQTGQGPAYALKGTAPQSVVSETTKLSPLAETLKGKLTKKGQDLYTLAESGEYYNTKYALEELAAAGLAKKFKNGKWTSLAASTAKEVPLPEYVYGGEELAPTDKGSINHAVFDLLQQGIAGGSAWATSSQLAQGLKIGGGWSGSSHHTKVALNSLVAWGKVKKTWDEEQHTYVYQPVPGIAYPWPQEKKAQAQGVAYTSASPITGKAAPGLVVPNLPPVTTASITSQLLDLPPLKIGELKQVGDKPGGSLTGAIYQAQDGKKYLVKHGYGVNKYWEADTTGEHAKNEALAAMLYQAAGVQAPNNRSVDLGGGKMGVASEWIENLQPGQKDQAAWKKQAQEDFAIHAWLSNWDVAGLDFDNLLTKDGKPICVDLGGSLLFRAQGKKKTSSEFNGSAVEWDSLRDPNSAPQASQIFAGMTDQQLVQSVAKVACITDEAIHALVNQWGPGSAGEKTNLAQTLIARKKDLVQRAQALAHQQQQVQQAAQAFNACPPVQASVQQIAASLPSKSYAEIAAVHGGAAKSAHYQKWGYYHALNAEAVAADPNAAKATAKQVLQDASGINMDTYNVNKSAKSQGATPYNLALTKKQTSQVYATLPSAEQNAINSYSGGGYTGQNQALRLGDVSGSAKKAAIAFQKISEYVPAGSYVERGLKLDPSHIANLKNHVGLVFQEPGFSSSSPTAPWSSNTTLCIHNAPGTKGSNVTAWGVHKSEDELLYGPNQRFMVIGVGHGPNLLGHESHLVHVIALPTEDWTGQ